jgi:hypothetical protein
VNPRRMFLSILMMAALGSAIAVPTLADAPTFSGVLTCTDAVTGEVRALETVTSATKHDLAVWRKFWSGTTFCAKGSFDTSGLTQDP